MNRNDFCSLMEQAKRKSGITTTEISFSMKMLLPTLRRFEKGEHNFNLQKVIDYLGVLNAGIVLMSGNKKTYCKTYNQLIDWLVNARTGKFSQRQLADAIGASYVMIARIESKKSNLTIDVFLKIANVLGYNIEIKNN